MPSERENLTAKLRKKKISAKEKNWEKWFRQREMCKAKRGKSKNL